MPNQGIAGKQRQLRELRDLKKSLTTASARAEVDAAIERVEASAAKTVRKYGKRRRKRAANASERVR